MNTYSITYLVRTNKGFQTCNSVVRADSMECAENKVPKGVHILSTIILG